MIATAGCPRPGAICVCSLEKQASHPVHGSRFKIVVTYCGSGPVDTDNLVRAAAPGDESTGATTVCSGEGRGKKVVL